MAFPAQVYPLLPHRLLRVELRVQGLNAVHHAAQLPSAELSTKCVQQLANLDFEAWEIGLKQSPDY